MKLKTVNLFYNSILLECDKAKCKKTSLSNLSHSGFLEKIDIKYNPPTSWVFLNISDKNQGVNFIWYKKMH